MRSEWSEFQTVVIRKESAAAGQNILKLDILAGQIAEVSAVELKNHDRAWVGGYAHVVNSGKPLSSTDVIGITQGVLLPSSGGGGGGGLVTSGKWFAKKAVIGVINNCSLNDTISLKLQIRYKDLRP